VPNDLQSWLHVDRDGGVGLNREWLAAQYDASKIGLPN
jgi:hypothetical protein